jgi:hypothetical protein
MSTLYERLCAFYGQNGEFRFSRKKLRLIANICKRIYDAHPEKNPPVSYTESIEEEGTFQVRRYHAAFLPTIDSVIQKVYRAHIDNVVKARLEVAQKARKLAQKAEAPPKSAQPVPVAVQKGEPPVRRERKRIPAQKPVYSTKKA